MRIDILTALPDIVRGPLEHTILRRAAQKGLVDIRVHDIREYTTDKHRQIDDYPYVDNWTIGGSFSFSL